MPWYLVGIAAITGLLLLLALGMPISFAFAFVGVAGIWLAFGQNSLFIVAQLTHDTLNSFVLITIPLFIFMAEILFVSGYSEDLFNTLEKWVGRLPGGLSVATISSCAAFSAVCGSSWVTAATIGKVALPEMMQRGYDKKLAAGSIAAGGTLGILIPPSLSFIIYGFMSDTSIGKLFVAGIVPGLILTSMFAIAIIVQALIAPEIAARAKVASWTERFRSLAPIWPIILVAVTVMGSIYAGIATPSEAAAIGTLLALLSGLISRRLKWNNLKEALMRTVLTAGFMFMLLIAAKIFAFFLAKMDVPNELAGIAGSLGSPLYILIGTYILLTIMGMFMEGMSILVLVVPVFVPLLVAVGFDAIWFGVILTMFIELALVTPPVGINCFIIRDIAAPYGVPLDDIFKGIVPFALGMVFTIILVSIFPAIALWLPGTMK